MLSDTEDTAGPHAIAKILNKPFTAFSINRLKIDYISLVQLYLSIQIFYATPHCIIQKLYMMPQSKGESMIMFFLEPELSH